MRGYDAWKLASPPEADWGTCQCGHSEEDHGEENGFCFLCAECDGYTEAEAPEPDPDRKRDERE